MKKNDLIIVIIFISFITIPSVAYWFIKDKMDNTNYENRLLYEKPELTVKNITEYPKKYESYFNDHLPFKNEIRKTRSKLLYNLFNISSNSGVVVGKDGWLFYNSKEVEMIGDSISDYTNSTRYNDKDKEKMANFLEDINNKIEKNNVELYFFIIPNKENVYSDKLEGIIKRSNNKESLIEDLIKYLEKNTKLKIIYPKKELVEGRKKYETYYKYDTHWNEYGAYLGINKLMKILEEKYEIPNIKITKQKASGDLKKMALLDVENNEPKVNNFYSNIEYKCEDIDSLKKCSSEDAIYNKTVLIVGDSFREATVPYLAKLYKNALFIHRDSYKEDLINKYDVDIVIYELVERYSYSLEIADMLIKY